MHPGVDLVHAVGMRLGDDRPLLARDQWSGSGNRTSYRYRVRGLGRLAAALVLVTALALANAVHVRGWVLFEYVRSGESRGLVTAVAGGDAGVTAATALGVVAGVVFLVWLLRARRNVSDNVSDAVPPGPRAGIRPRPPVLSAWWAVGAWFVPVANLVLPPIVLGDVWRNSRPDARPGYRLIIAWWLTLCAALLLNAVADMTRAAPVNRLGPRVAVPAFQAAAVLNSLGALCTLTSGVLLTRFILRVSGWQTPAATASRAPGGRGRWRRAAVALAVVWLLAVGGLALSQRTLIYSTAAAPVPPVTVAGPTARAVTVPTEDGLALTAWLITPTGPDRRGHVLFLHGNAGHRGVRAGLARRMAAAGFTVLLLDYRGFGGNPGMPTEAGLGADARAGRQFLLEHAGARPERMYYFGESLGSAVATGLAATHPPAGLVLRSPFTDLASVGEKQLPTVPVRLLLADRFPLIEHIRRVPSPTIVIYGDADRLIPPEQSEAVATATPHLIRMIPVAGADHNDPQLADSEHIISALNQLSGHQGS